MFKFFKKDIPEWVKIYPEELDRQGLLALAKTSKGPFSKPREMNYVLYIDASEKAKVEKIVPLLEKEEWLISSGELPEDQLFFIEAQKADYAITHEVYEKDVKYFKELASKFNVHYDGWFASS